MCTVPYTSSLWNVEDSTIDVTIKDIKSSAFAHD